MAKRISTMELLERICREDSERPDYKLVPELDGIEIYFKEKPDDETIAKMKSNHWRWHRSKHCWYTKNTPDSLLFARSLCGYEKKQTTAPQPRPSVSPPKPAQLQTVSYNMINGNQTIGTFTITKVNQGYTINSTNNLMSCCDCYHFLSIHARSCPNCGCPTSYIAEFYYKKGVKGVSEQERAEAEKRRQEALRQRQIEEVRRIAEEKRRQEALERQRQEAERKRKEEEKIQARAAEIREICKSLDLPNVIISDLAKKGVDDKTLRARVDRILYYQNRYPELGINECEFIRNDNLSSYISRKVVEERVPRVDCVGNCSICRREECVLSSKR